MQQLIRAGFKSSELRKKNWLLASDTWLVRNCPVCNPCNLKTVVSYVVILMNPIGHTDNLLWVCQYEHFFFFSGMWKCIGKKNNGEKKPVIFFYNQKRSLPDIMNVLKCVSNRSGCTMIYCKILLKILCL